MKMSQPKLYVTVAALCLAAFSGADRHAEQLLRQAQKLSEGIKSLQAIIEVEDEPGLAQAGGTATLTLQKPDLLFLISPEADGKKNVAYMKDGHFYSVDEATNSGQGSNPEEFYTFANFEPSCMAAALVLEPTLFRSFLHPAFAGVKTHNGAKYQMVKCPPAYGRNEVSLYFGPSGLLEGVEFPAVNSPTERSPHMQIWLTHLRVNEPIPAVDLSYSPPKSAQISVADIQPDLLRRNSVAPAFDVVTTNGEHVTLTSLLKGRKALLLNFTFATCESCVGELPTLAELYKELKGQGLEILAVNITDDSATAKGFIKKYAVPYPMGLDSKPGGGTEQIESGYHAGAGGINILVGANGKVLWSYVGMNETRLRCLLADLGVPAFPGG